VSRQENNRKILALLQHEIETQPDVRFGQALRNLGLVSEIIEDGVPVAWRNEFYLESKGLWERAKKTASKSGLEV